MIKKLHTPCKKCIFATYEDITQTGCKLNLIEKFKQYDTEVIEAFDEEKEFYIINGTKCIHMRASDWTGSTLPLEEQITQVTKETNLHFHAIVILDNSIENLKNTINSLTAQTLKPSQITLIRKVDNTIPPSELVEICSTLLTNIKWRIERLVVSYENMEDIYDLILPFIKNSIYIVFKSGFIVPEATLLDISNYIVDHFLKFVMILPNKDGNGFVTLKSFNEYYKGFSGATLKDKLEKDGCPSELFIPITKLLPYFPE